MSPITILVIVLLSGILLIVLLKLQQARRSELIRNYKLPPGLYDKLRKRHAHLSLKDCQLVGHALRQFFLAYLKSGKQEVSMPSQVVDDLWHELILYTRDYEIFCRRAFGKFLHHTPAAAFSEMKRTSADTHNALRRCWYQACREEDINPQRPTRLPLLFALDRKLNIEGGFIYVLDCRKGAELASIPESLLPVYCAADLKPLAKRAGGSSCGGGCSGGGHSCSGSSGCSGGCGGD